MSVKRIVINDPDADLVGRLNEMLGAQGRSFDVIPTRDGEEALEIISRLPVDLLITGLKGAKLDGYQLIAEVSRRHPQTKIITLVTSNSPLPRAILRRLGTSATYTRPVNPEDIARAVFTHLQIRANSEVWGISLTSFLQMLNADQKTCTLTVSRTGESGKIFIQQGDIIAVECGSKLGDDALYSILSWENPIIEIDYTPFTKWKTISSGLMSMLMESQRRKDDALAAALQSRRYGRFECLVAVDFQLDGTPHQHLIRDMSEGGAYIETDAPLVVGAQLELTLYSMRQKQECVIRSQVVRQGSNGFGIKFVNVDDAQRAFIRDMRDSI